jgi:hypothetical protein
MDGVQALRWTSAKAGCAETVVHGWPLGLAGHWAIGLLSRIEKRGCAGTGTSPAGALQDAPSTHLNDTASRGASSPPPHGRRPLPPPPRSPI